MRRLQPSPNTRPSATAGPSRLRLSPDVYRALTLVALLAVAFIIITGAAVRLTGSGLGCSDWPACEQDRLVAPLEFHPMVEFVNRMITGLVSVAVILAVLGSLARVPRRRDLLLLSWGLVAGVVAQIVLGGLTVLFHLKPPFVMGHFLLSIVLLGNALVLHHRAGLPDGAATRDAVPPTVRSLGQIVFGVTCLALFTGTIVTAAGPHGGDEEAERLSWPLPDVTRVHGTTVMLLALLVVALVVRAQHDDMPTRFRRACSALLGAIVVQAIIGYVQYFSGVPALLVGFHVAGAVVVFTAATYVQLEMRAPVPAPRTVPPLAAPTREPAFG
jgi:cytochrome c oxidase assembly protein subunit 15